jgi:type IV pilus assembly protein PilB
MDTIDLVIPESNRGIISGEIAWHYRILPAQKSEHVVSLYVDRETKWEDIRNELTVILGFEIDFIPSPSDQITKALTKYFVGQDQKSESTPSGDFVLNLIESARRLHSSDIHIETYDQKCRIRFRIDGKLVERMTLNKSDYPSLINRVKISAGLDISEKRLPQDGRIVVEHQSNRFDLRVSVIPTLFGEKIVLRILGSGSEYLDLNSIGFSEKDLLKYKQSIRKPSGMILISGPTGSGKTTTLYSTLKVLNRGFENILTIEDPVEYTLEGINQVQVRDDIGLSFSRTLRAFLRQDPDIIMIGEIRDQDTASLAVRASLTGHLVLSTIHTNSAWSSVSRLMDMGIPDYLLASTLNTLVAQRLVRVLCASCKREEKLDINLLPPTFKNKVKNHKHYLAVGCDACYFTGYVGRHAIYELVDVDMEIAAIIRKGSYVNIDEVLNRKGVVTIAENAFDVFEKGQTSLDEILTLLLNEEY